VTRSRSSVSARRRRRPSPASRCSRRPWTRVRPATTSAAAPRLKKTEIERGQVIAKPGSINPHTKFEAEVYALSKEEGGRHTPFFSGYRPQFYFRTTDVTGSAILVGAEMCHAGRQRRDDGRADHPDRDGPRRSASPSAKAAAPSAPAV
jgi:hypothetical protein